ncbi:hypothetical protein Gpo141_00009614 [Globisporangium polare]
MASSRNSNDSSTSGSGNAIANVSGTLPSKSVSSDSHETCGCHASGIARTCSECLNTKLQTGQACAVNPYGVCMEAAAADSYEYYFNATYYAGTTPLHGNEFFWSVNATYCQSDDVTCTGCRAKWVDAFRNQSLSSSFSCVGAGGCVCTAYCELRQTSDLTALSSYNIGSEVCYPQSGADPWNDSYQRSLSMARSIMALLVGTILVAMVARHLIVQFRQKQHDRRIRERDQARRRQRDETSRFGLMLTLEGWNGYHEQLIEHEQETLGLKSGPLLTEAPTRAIIQEGEGYRPASPRQATR